jgi:hypothetical protein
LCPAALCARTEAEERSNVCKYKGPEVAKFNKDQRKYKTNEGEHQESIEVLGKPNAEAGE